MDLARAPRRAPLTARKKGSGYENDQQPDPGPLWGPPELGPGDEDVFSLADSI
jgi:hypothetical protein